MGDGASLAGAIPLARRPERLRRLSGPGPGSGPVAGVHGPGRVPGLATTARAGSGPARVRGLPRRGRALAGVRLLRAADRVAGPGDRAVHATGADRLDPEPSREV